MTDLALVILFTCAIGIGFFLGRRSVSNKAMNSALFAPGKSYFQGLNFLLNEQPDKAVEEFVRLLEVNTYTLETHLALGKLMRKQGQVDRAIRIHQNLLARPQLEPSDQHQVHLELARDFMAAGLLDRAEALLQEVIAESAVLRSIAQRYLMDIYQDESEWQDAVHVAQAVLQSKYMKSNPDERREISRMVAHFYCQLAEESNSKRDYDSARKYLDLAAAADKSVLRVALLIAANDHVRGRHKAAVKVLSRIETQSPEWFGFCTQLLQDAYLQLDEDRGFDNFVAHLTAHVESHKSSSVCIFLVNQLLARAEEEPSRIDQANAILSSYIDRHASLTAASKLVELKLSQSSLEGDSEIHALQKQVAFLLERRQLFRCGNCGFSGRQLHWRCPSCKKWDSIFRLDDKSVV